MPFTRARLRLVVGGVAASSLLIAGASATEPAGDQFRVSNQQPDGDPDFGALAPASTHNSADDRYLTVWQGETATDDEFEIFGRLTAADGAPVGAPFRISDMGPDGDIGFRASEPAVTYNATANEYLVTWRGNDDTPPLAAGENEIFTQRLSADGAEIGGDTRVSNMGPDGDTSYFASAPAVAYNSTANEYLVIWRGEDDTGALVNGEFEIFAQRLSADGAEIGGDTRVSDMGPDGSTFFSAFSPAVVYNATTNEYLVAWNGDDNTPPLVDNENEVFVQRLSGTAVEIGGDTRISDMGPDGDASYAASAPVVAYNSTTNEYLVSWEGEDDTGALVEGEFEIYAQRLSAGGTEVGGDTRISDMGPDGSTSYRGFSPAVAYNSMGNEYLVTWEGDDDTAPLVDNEREIFAQRISADGVEIAGDTRISNAGPDGDSDYEALDPTVAYNAVANEYLVGWWGDDNTAPLVDDEYEIYARRIRGGEAPPDGTPPGGGIPGTDGAPSAANCATPPTFTGGGSSGSLSLTSTQLRINQRIGQAAVRRANAIQGWLDDGLVNADLCGGSLTGDQLDPGVAYSTGLLQAVPAKADPRTLSIPAATPKPGVTFAITAEQLQINQRVYSAAVRRANALRARVEGELTGGDITDAQLTSDRLRQDLERGVLTPPVSVASASTTRVAPPAAKMVTFTPNLKQLGINQKIAQAAVKRTNELRTLLGAGLSGENFADGSISAVDFAP